MTEQCISKLATRPILYTDEVGGEQTLRDDLWAVTTEELNEQSNLISKIIKEVEALHFENHAEEQMRRQSFGYNKAIDVVLEILRKHQ